MGILKPLLVGNPFPPLPPNLSISDEVTFIRASDVSSEGGDIATGLYGDDFRVSVLDVTDVSEPDDLYTGIVNSACAEGVVIEQAESVDKVLVYSPPNPPNVLYNFDFPNKPNLVLSSMDFADNDTDVSILAVMSDLFMTLEEQANLFVDDILANLSITSIEQFNDKSFSSPLGSMMGFMGIGFSGEKARIINNRFKNSISRRIMMVNRKANNSNTSSHLQGLNSEKRYAHDTEQQARLDNAKLNTSLNMQKIALSLLLYNEEVMNANVLYTEYSSIADIEVEKLNLFKKQIDNYDKAQGGNEELITAYKKQLAVVQQVFETLEQEMNLSELIIKISGKQIDVDTANINTDMMLIQGDVNKADSIIYQTKTDTMAYGMNDDGILAKASADLVAYRANLGNTILALDTTSKNDLISADNDLLTVLAESAGIKARAVNKLFNLDNSGYLNAAENSFLSSHTKSQITLDKQKTVVSVEADKHAAKMETVDDGRIANDGARRGSELALEGLEQYLRYIEAATRLIRTASTELKLDHNITST